MSPVVIPKHLPANQVLKKENIFVMNQDRAQTQDIRPLQILIVNLMPLKEVTETQLLRLLGNTLLQVEITLLHMSSHQSKNTSKRHLDSFYKTIEDVKERRYDGMIVTGAPVETLAYEEVNYWQELTGIMDWAKDHVFSSMYVCWAAQAGLYYQHGIEKTHYKEKLFGIFQHGVKDRKEPLFRGFDDDFSVPHSRHTGIDEKAVRESKDLDVLSDSEEAGIYIVADRQRKNFYVTGHPEYDRDTLYKEYRRDKDKGLDQKAPAHYFSGAEDLDQVIMTWKGHAHLLFSNWLNYYIYQRTAYDFTDDK